MDGWQFCTLKVKVIAMVIFGLLTATVIGAVVYLATAPVDGQCLTENDDIRKPLSAEGLLNGSTDFGFALFSRLAPSAQQSESNLVLSSFSIWSALLMTYLGSRRQTESQLSNVLGLHNASKADVGRAYKAIKYWYKLREQNQENYTLNLANKVFVEKTLNIRECMQKQFGNEIIRLDFERAPEVARIAMNSWVEDETRQKIRELFPPGLVDGRTLITLVNAAYFKGKWENQFKKENTKKQPFYVTPAREVIVDMMHQKGVFYHGVSPQFEAQVLELSFIGEEVSMMFLLPTDGISLELMARKLSTENLKAVRLELRKNEVEVAIPKFKLEHSFELSQALTSMGIQDLFIVSQADLTGFSADGRLAVTTVRHKAFIEVNEEGSEAAAATGILAWRSARPSFPATFIANKPFVFFIHDNLSDAILFMGAVSRPEVTNDI